MVVATVSAILLGLASGPALARLSCALLRRRGCRPRCPPRLPLASSLACAASFGAVSLSFGPTPECLELLALAGALLVVAVSDALGRVIPNEALLASACVRIAYLLGEGVASGRSPLPQLAGALLAGACLSAPSLAVALAARRAVGRRPLGLGDVKLLFVVGLFVGWWRGALALLLSCALGATFALCRARVREGPATEGRLRLTFPLGPWLALTCLLALVARPAGIGVCLGVP